MEYINGHCKAQSLPSLGFSSSGSDCLLEVTLGIGLRLLGGLLVLTLSVLSWLSVGFGLILLKISFLLSSTSFGL